MAAADGGDVDIEDPPFASQNHFDGAALQKVPYSANLLRCHLGENLQLQLRPSRHHTGCHGGLDALEASGVGHSNGLDVFYNVSADLRPAGLRLNAQGPDGALAAARAMAMGSVQPIAGISSSCKIFT